jgi:hypothetical protein
MSDAPVRFDDSELVGTLESNRGVVERKLAGLDRDAATRVVTASGTTILGIVKHLTWVERTWFEVHLLGIDVDVGTIDASFRIDADDTVETVLAAYRTACGTSRTVLAECKLDDIVRRPHWYFGSVDVRFVVFHMTRETARHAGHLDILRELTDGATGY